MTTEIEKKEQYFDIYEQMLADYEPLNNESKESILEFLRDFPDLPTDSAEAFSFIQSELSKDGFEYDAETFLLEDVVDQKKGNCLGLSVLFGMILKGKGLNPQFEVAVNPKDAHYTNDIRQFEKLKTGGMFSYDNLPELPVTKNEAPQNRFTPLEHPVITLEDKRYETTTLLQENEDIIHDYDNESSREVDMENLIGSMYMSEAKTMYGEDTPDYNKMIELAEKGLEMWPQDRQGWLFLRDLGISTFNDSIIEKSEQKFLEIGGDDSLFYLSRYEITNDENDLDKALEKYPAYVAAYVGKKVKRPLESEEAKADARFDLTVGAQATANARELSLDFYYMSHIEDIKEAFGEEEAESLLYDLEMDEKMPVQYLTSMYSINGEYDFLIRADEAGILEKSSPMEQLNFCLEVIKDTKVKNADYLSLKEKCLDLLTEMDSEYGESKLYQTVKSQA